MSFHAHDGWHFERLETGEVRMTKRVPVIKNNLHPEVAEQEVRTSAWVESVTFDPSTWASIVASVTPDGDVAETFRKALLLHAEG